MSTQIIIDTCALLDSAARKCFEKKVLSGDENNVVGLLSKVERELELKLKSANELTQKEAEAAIGFYEKEYPERFERRKYARPKGLPDCDFKADEEIEYCCREENSKGNSVVLYTLDNPLAYKLTHRMGDAKVCVRILEGGRSRDYCTEVLPGIQANLQALAGKFDVYVTAAAIRSRGFGFCMDDLGFLRALRKAGGNLYVLSCTLKLLSGRKRQWFCNYLKPQVLRWDKEDERDEFHALTDLLTAMETRRRSLLLCAVPEHSQYSSCCRERAFYTQNRKACVVAMMANSGQIVTPELMRFRNRRQPLAKPAAPPAAPAGGPVAEVSPKEQMEKAIKQGDLPEVSRLIAAGCNPVWALMACLQSKRCDALLPELLKLVGGKPVGKEVFCWVVGKYLPGIWFTSSNPWQEMARVLPLLLQIIPLSEPLRECVDEVERLKRWYDVCSEETVKALLGRTLQATAA